MAKFAKGAPAAFRKNVLQQQMRNMTQAEKRAYVNQMYDSDKVLFPSLCKKIKS